MLVVPENLRIVCGLQVSVFANGPGHDRGVTPGAFCAASIYDVNQQCNGNFSAHIQIAPNEFVSVRYRATPAGIVKTRWYKRYPP